VRRATVLGIKSRPYGKTSEDGDVDLYTLTNAGGASVSISTFGGTVVSLRVPDRKGTLGDVVLGFPEFRDYEKNSPYFGCLIGRFGNRIAKGRFRLDDRDYQLATNNNGQSLHGGWRGFDKVIWSAVPKMTSSGPSLVLSRTSPDGEEGYPGTLKVKATYTLTDRNELKLVYRAVTDKATIVNLTQHNYFNLAGEGSGTILDHKVTLKASRFTPVDRHLIPSGVLQSVKGTPFDFRKPHLIGERIDQPDPQLEYAGGYDHNWVADKAPGRIGLLATVEDPKSGRVLKVLSDQPGVQFYTGNFLDGTLVGHSGRPYSKRGGFCLEPQHFPDSPNHPDFPSVVLRPGQVYKNTIIYRFTTKA
jgi:aldose 1-epimerase